jgi:hypothetical protein
MAKGPEYSKEIGSSAEIKTILGENPKVIVLEKPKDKKSPKAKVEAGK